MAKLGKNTVAQTFKFDCDRFLRFEIASNEEMEAVGIERKALGSMRPGLQLMTAAGRQWEAQKYQDLVDTVGEVRISHRRADDISEEIGMRPFQNINNMFEILGSENPPFAILEAEFDVSAEIAEGLKEAQDVYGLNIIKARPDIIWIRPARTGSPLINDNGEEIEYELHIIDVKMAAEPSLKHFTEVTFYALALAEAIKINGLDGRYKVSAEGLVWPGNHDVNKFKNLINNYRAKGNEFPVVAALEETLVGVPYEIYEIHVKNFFDDRLLRLIKLPLDEAQWHVSSKCQLCQYLKHCTSEAKENDLVCRIPWTNQGHQDLLKENSINTTSELHQAITDNSENWQKVKKENHHLNADEKALCTRSNSLATNNFEIIQDRNCAFFPRYSNMSIYLTIHFDPGTGLTFAMGAKRIYFPPDYEPGNPPTINSETFIVDRVDNLNPQTERNRLIELIDLIEGWLSEAHEANEEITRVKRAEEGRDSDFGKVTVHFFLWNSLEIKQFKRTIERHLNSPEMVTRLETLIRLFPPDSILPPDIRMYKSQPGTIVKDALKLLVGLPIPHDYTLLQAASNFDPDLNDEGEPYHFYSPYGFQTDLNDQIPFERAYELWKDSVYLKHKDDRKYTRTEIINGITRAVNTRIRALEHITKKLREHCGPQLVLKKTGFSIPRIPQQQIPESARRLLAFENLDVITRELEIRNKVAFPAKEKEARFISISGINFSDKYDDFIEEVRMEDDRLLDKELIAFTVSEASRDAKIKEGDFLLAMGNEEHTNDYALTWYKNMGLNYYEGAELMNQSGITQPWFISANLGTLLQVELIKFNSTDDIPFIIIRPSIEDLFSFAQQNGIINLNEPLILDPIFRDYNSSSIERVLRIIGR